MPGQKLPTSGLIGTITGMLCAFNTVATSPHSPEFSDLCFPIIIPEAVTCLLLLLNAIITHIDK